MSRVLVCVAVVFFLCSGQGVHGETDDEDAAQGSGEVNCTVAGCQGIRVCDETSGDCECPSGYVEEFNSTACIARQSLAAFQFSSTVVDNSFQYTPQLSDPNSQEFQDYEKTWCDNLGNSLQNSDLDYSGCEVTSFEEGSVIVNYIIHVATSNPVNASVVTAAMRDSTLADNCTLQGIVNRTGCHSLGGLIVEVQDKQSIKANTDFNECEDRSINGCHQNATCLDTPTSYTCTCNSGFSGDGITCSAIVEGFRTELKPPVCLERVKYILIFVNSVLLASFVMLLIACISTKKKADLVDASLFSDL